MDIIPDIYNLDNFNTSKYSILHIDCEGLDITITYNNADKDITTHHNGYLVNGLICYNLHLGAYATSKIWMPTFKLISSRMRSYTTKPIFDINDLDNGYLLLQFHPGKAVVRHTFYIINKPSPLVDNIIYNITKTVRNFVSINSIIVNTDESYMRFGIFTNNINYNPLRTPPDISKMTFIKQLHMWLS